MFGGAVAVATGLLIVAAATSVLAQIKLKPGAIEGKGVHNANVRGYAYCEIAPVLGTPPEIVAQVYNTSAPEDYCPLDKMEAIDAQKLAAELGADFVYMNPTPQTARRHWVMDELWIFTAGESVDFKGVRATWMASMTAEVMKNFLQMPYTPAEIHQESNYLYSKGSKVFLIRAPEGKTWIMQSYTTEVDGNLTFEQLSELGSKLKLPNGYSFEVVTLTKDLTIDPRKAAGVAYVMRDDLHNVYEGCGFDATCDHIP